MIRFLKNLFHSCQFEANEWATKIACKVCDREYIPFHYN